MIPLAPIALAGVALAAAGCLFIGAINQAPTAALAVVGGPMPDGDGAVSLTMRCATVELDPSGSSDPDQGDAARLTFEWSIDGHPAASVTGVEFRIDDLGHARLQLDEAGEVVVELVAIDPHGARSSPARLTLRVADAPPLPSVQADPPGPCGDHPAGGTVRLDALAADADADCKPIETIAFTWTLTPPQGSTKATLWAGPCDAAPPGAGQSVVTTGQTVCVAPDVEGEYSVQVVADDGAMRSPATVAGDGQTAPPITFRLAPDRPPCMDGFDPAPGLLYVLDRTQPAQFAVTRVLDDLDGFPNPNGPSTAQFRWSLWRESDPAWRALPMSGLNTLELDPGDFDFDELVQVRVEALDRVARAPTPCDPAQLLCDAATAWPGVPSCRPGDTCEEWVTWQARFR